MMFLGARGSLALMATTLFSSTNAQFPPHPEGLTRVNSTAIPGSYISYKETSICETTPGVRGYSGYVHLPANLSSSRPYSINTYFWFFESRSNPETAPLAVWIQGGPGVPSITAAVGENGPCTLAPDSMTTINNPWSWNNKVNMLYVDQPVQVGFSYDSLVNGTIDQLKTGPVHVNVTDFGNATVPKNTETKFAGTFASQKLQNTVNTTEASTVALWEFMQTWSKDFPRKTAHDGKFGLWTESYGGHYGPAAANYFDSQNKVIAAGKLPNAIPLTMDALGIVNGCIDMKVQMPLYPQMAFNNTYGIQRINQTQFTAAINSWPACEAKIDACRAADGNSSAPRGTNKTVTDACLDAFMFCFAKLHDGYPLRTVNHFDLTKTLPDDTIPKWAAGYLNRAEIQAALGVPLNFTGESEAVAAGFNLTGDFVYGGGLDRLSSLLNRGGKVALIYGDADYECNWLGGEQISLSLNANTSPAFHTAGYADISTNDSYVGGVVRQSSNLSFSRVFNAGHEVPYYQPETALRIFERTMFDRDVATGEVCTHENPDYLSKGGNCAFEIKNKANRQTPPSCYMWDVLETCTPAEGQMLANGTGVVKDFVLQS